MPQEYDVPLDAGYAVNAQGQMVDLAELGIDPPETLAEWNQRQADAAFAAANPPPPTPTQLAAVPAQMLADNLAASFTTTDQVATVAGQLHTAAKVGIANFKSDLAAWKTLTDAQKLSHVEGLMQSMVGVLQHLTGDYS